MIGPYVNPHWSLGFGHWSFAHSACQRHWAAGPRMIHNNTRRSALDRGRGRAALSRFEQKVDSMKQEMLINVAQPEECRIAIVEDGTLEELYIERSSQDNYVGNIYKGKIVNLEPSIQAAFVDFGVGRNGFLHISDVEPQYF